MKKIIVIRGPLGVGKSTVSQILAYRFHTEYLSLDQLLKDHDLEGADGIPLTNFLTANNLIAQRASQSRMTFVIDGCFYYQEQIDDLIEKFGGDVVIFSLLSDVETCIERDSKRESVNGEDSVRFVHMITTRVKVGHEIDNTFLSVEETVERIMEQIQIPR